MKHVVRRLSTVAVATLTCLGAVPASADVVAGGGGGSAGDCVGLHCWSGTITANVTPIDNSGYALVTWDCQATGTVDPVSTSITTCSVGGVDAPALSAPGAFIATGWATVLPLGSTADGCVGGESAFAEAMLGDQRVGASRCTPLVIVALPL